MGMIKAPSVQRQDGKPAELRWRTAFDTSFESTITWVTIATLQVTTRICLRTQVLHNRLFFSQYLGWSPSFPLDLEHTL